MTPCTPRIPLPQAFVKLDYSLVVMLRSEQNTGLDLKVIPTPPLT